MKLLLVQPVNSDFNFYMWATPIVLNLIHDAYIWEVDGGK